MTRSMLRTARHALLVAALASGAAAFRAGRPAARTRAVPVWRQQGSCRVAMSTRGDGLPCGSLVALITPMFADGSVDEEALRKLFRWHVDCGTDGLVVLGTTGEASTLSPAERLNVLRITQEEAVGKLPVVIGTGAIQPAAAIKMGEEAAEHGASGVLVVTPYYVKPTQKGLIKYYEQIADNSPLPIVLYNVPGRTGVDMTPITIGALSEHPRIVGVKEATGDVMRVAPLRELCGPNFLLYSGDDGTAVDFVLAGGDGTISVTSNVAPSMNREVMACARIGDATRARELNAQLELLHRRLFLQPNPIPVKWALERMGKAGSGIRLPLTQLEPEFHTQLIEAMEVAGLLS